MRVNAYTVCAFNYVIHLPGEIRQTDRQTESAKFDLAFTELTELRESSPNSKEH